MIHSTGSHVIDGGDIDIQKVSPKQKIGLLVKHLELFKDVWGDKKHFENMKKFVKCYVNNFNGASDTREKLMKTKTLDELIEKTRGITIKI